MRKSVSFVFLLSLAVAACNNGGPVTQTKQITKTEKLNEAPAAPTTLPTSSQRFGTNHAHEMAGMTGTTPPMASGTGSSSAASLAWTKPDGWDELPATAMRQANFKVTGSPDTECYMSILGNTGGGIEMNVNRWRKQMSQPDYSSDEIAKLPRKTVLGQQAVLLDIDGTFTGMGGGGNKDGYKLLGAILEYQGSGVFVKMIGPSADVEKQKANFEAFLTSLHPAENAGTRVAQAPAMSGNLPAGHPAVGSVGGMTDGASSAPFTWQAPDGWKKGADRPMRVVTYNVGASGKTECVISMLSGAAGGVDANINRWRGQMGQAPVTPTEIAALPKVKVMGQDAPLLEVSGSYTGMSGGQESGYMMLGTIGDVTGGKVFIKMVGPEDEVKAEKDHFIAFCQSLK